MTAILENILTTIQTEIQNLNLTEIANEHVHIQKSPSTRNFTSADFPAILISPGNLKHNPAEGTNLRDQIEYQIGIFIVDADNQNQTINRGKYLSWYETILKQFRTPRLSGVGTIVNSYVAPGLVVDPAWFEAGEFHAGVSLWFISWETRS
ncbi:hypothetical protein Pan153_61080 [Gimesia panareensis]|uniref:Uncharacterized protein n=1 Tax=Gimesia panareensis TaxID=2527978 RepID=A0A518FYS3_9PLAN|nr:hypothetical protein [Gimesia panareensis]QDV21420.1 hypothetical protein Pan153_61080 [Gimesia panareensis]